MKGILEAAGKSFFRELSEHTFKKATESIVTEGVKAAVEIWKRRRIRVDEYEFAEWKKEQSKAHKDSDGAKEAEATSSDSSDEEAPKKDDSAEEADGDKESKA